MSNLDDLRNKYKTLSDVKVPEDVKDRIHTTINRQAPAPSTMKPKKWTQFLLNGTAAIAMIAVVVGVGLQIHSKHSSSTPQQRWGPYTNAQKTNSSGTTSGVPVEFIWNGRSYNTKGYIQTVGSQLGITTYPDGPEKVFAMPGKDPNKEIAVEVDLPAGKYVSTVWNNQGWIEVYNTAEKPRYYTLTSENAFLKGQLFGVYSQYSQGSSGFVAPSLPNGTKMFKIPGVDWKNVFAVQTKGGYVLAVYYGSKPPTDN